MLLLSLLIGALSPGPSLVSDLPWAEAKCVRMAWRTGVRVRSSFVLQREVCV